MKTLSAIKSRRLIAFTPSERASLRIALEVFLSPSGVKLSRDRLRSARYDMFRLYHSIRP